MVKRAQTSELQRAPTGAPKRVRAVSFGFNNGRYNVGRYSNRNFIVVDLAPRFVQKTVGKAVLSGKLFDLSAHIYQTTPGRARLDQDTLKSISVRIIQTEPCFVELDVLPPRNAIATIVQKTPVVATFSPFASIFDARGKVVQKTTFKATVRFVQDLSPSFVQNVYVKSKIDFCHVADFRVAASQKTIFIPGVNAGWSPWYPINPDYPAPWNDGPVREAA